MKFPLTQRRLVAWLLPLVLLLGVSRAERALRAEEIRIEPARVEIPVGGTQQLLVTALGDAETDLTTTAAYGSSNGKVAAVSASGVIRGLEPGASNIEIHVGCKRRQLPVVVGSSAGAPVRFGTDVVPILTRLSCNGGGCHGKASGQNGFKLSLLGFEPELDFDSLVSESRGRRLFSNAPHQSLLLLKATARVPHGGGRRLEESSDDYRLLSDWIAAGAPGPRADDPQLDRLELVPRERVLGTNSNQQLLVTAWFSDGTSRDVTRQSVYQANEPNIATVSNDGLVTTTAQHGLVAVMARFGEKMATFRATVPLQRNDTQSAAVQTELARLEERLQGSPVDRLLLRQWKRMAVVPSAEADDATFLRRAMIDICGTLPTGEEVAAYLADTHPDKRRRLIDRLLDRPEYATWFALKWADILQNRGAGYSTSKQRPGTTLFAGWIRDSFAVNKPYDRFVTELLTASGSQNENPPAVWYRSVRKPPEFVESVAQAFLGVRIQCAQCHHHPAERWSQADYYGLAAVFARVGRKGGFADAEVPTDEIIYVKESGAVYHPQTGEPVPPRALGGPEFQTGRHDDPRVRLARWMTQPENPFFARTMANRMWAHFLGRGIIHPLDDFRSTNPPSNPELLDTLARSLIDSGYDVKQLIRTICNSYAYRLQSAPNEWNADDADTFARFHPRRMAAEVLLDGFSQVLDIPTVFTGGPGKIPVGTRAIELPDENFPMSFLDTFGRPARMTACECERVDAPALTQALELVNSAEIQRKLTADSGYAKRLADSGKSGPEIAAEIFPRVLGRPPRPEEVRAVADFLAAEPDRAEACRSLLWSLLATNEFLFNH
jgi:hypothetical protein